jgi:uncharacterized protein YkwD
MPIFILTSGLRADAIPDRNRRPAASAGPAATDREVSTLSRLMPALLLALLPACVVVVPVPRAAPSAIAASMPVAAVRAASVPADIAALRQAAGLAPLAGDPRLAVAARVQAAFMAETVTMTHRGPRGDGVLDRVRRAGYEACRAAENVAFGQETRAQVLADWMASPGHRRNILDRAVEDVAVASSRGADGRLYWAMVLAAPC